MTGAATLPSGPTALGGARAVRRRSAASARLPGRNLGLGVTLAWLGILVAAPLAALAIRPWELGLGGVARLLLQPRTLAALRLSFGVSALAAATDVALGLMIAWTLTRYAFPGRRLLDAIVDLPFALPTAVAGIALTALYAPTGLIGAAAAEVGIKTAYTPLGVFIALAFIGLPFVVRAVQPVLADLDPQVEEAALTLGAGPLQRAWRVIIPSLAPAVVSGAGLAFARAVGEYGSVIFIAGNLPMRTEIAPLLIVMRLEAYDYAGAAAIGLVMAGASMVILLAVNVLQVRLAGVSRR